MDILLRDIMLDRSCRSWRGEGVGKASPRLLNQVLTGNVFFFSTYALKSCNQIKTKQHLYNLKS